MRGSDASQLLVVKVSLSVAFRTALTGTKRLSSINIRTYNGVSTVMVESLLVLNKNLYNFKIWQKWQYKSLV